MLTLLKVAELEGEVRRVNQALGEKTSALSTTRKHLKNIRERNMVSQLSLLCGVAPVSLLIN